MNARGTDTSGGPKPMGGGSEPAPHQLAAAPFGGSDDAMADGVDTSAARPVAVDGTGPALINTPPCVHCGNPSVCRQEWGPACNDCYPLGPPPPPPDRLDALEATVAELRAQIATLAEATS